MLEFDITSHPFRNKVVKDKKYEEGYVKIKKILDWE